MGIEEEPKYQASEKTNVVSIGEWTYYQNTHLQGYPAWACYFGKEYACEIFEINNSSYELIVKKGDWLSKNCEIAEHCFKNSFEAAFKHCEQYMK